MSVEIKCWYVVLNEIEWPVCFHLVARKVWLSHSCEAAIIETALDTDL